MIWRLFDMAWEIDNISKLICDTGRTSILLIQNFIKHFLRENGHNGYIVLRCSSLVNMASFALLVSVTDSKNVEIPR